MGRAESLETGVQIVPWEQAMKVLLVEPDYHRLTPDKARANVAKKKSDDESRWYPPLGLMKLSRFHKQRGDEVRFAYGRDRTVMNELWDRVYVTTLFTYHWDAIVQTINFYKQATGGITGNVFVGGVMASMMGDDLHEATGIYPVQGTLDSARMIGFDDNTNIDLLPPDYDLVDGDLYAVNDTFHGYASRGCKLKCAWCAVPRIEPERVNYINIKTTIKALRKEFGDRSRLKLMDNNIVASPGLADVVDDLVKLGYGRGAYTKEGPKKQRVVDFNQGLDATYINDKTMEHLGRLNIKPFRVAFDRVQEKKGYLAALRCANKHGVWDFSNYMLYNWKDTPRDLYERMLVNVELNAEWREDDPKNPKGSVYSYPMRYAPIPSAHGDNRFAARTREHVPPLPEGDFDYLGEPVWNPRFVRNVEIMKGAANGAISTTPGLAMRTIGESFDEFVTNLYMPEVLLRNRNKHEERVYAHDPKRRAGTGKVEGFRCFVTSLAETRPEEFVEFHNAVSRNTRAAIREYRKRCKSKEIKTWLELYLKR